MKTLQKSSCKQIEKSNKISTGTGPVKRAIPTMKTYNNGNLKDKNIITENVNKGLRLLRFTMWAEYRSIDRSNNTRP